MAVEDCIKNSKVCREALETAFEISKLIKISPKRNATFDRIKAEIVNDSSVGGIRRFCPTRWTLRGGAIKSILENYDVLNQLWEECLEERLEPDVKGRIIGVRAQMSQYNLLFGLKLSERILCITDNLSKILQRQSLSAAEAQDLAELTNDTLKSLRTDEAFDLFYQLVEHLSDSVGADGPTLPRTRKAPKRYEIGEGEGYHSPTVSEHYHQLYFEAIDLVTSGIKDRFDQPGYAIYRNLELLKAANKEEYSSELIKVVTFFGSDVNESELTSQLLIFTTKFTAECQANKRTILMEIIICRVSLKDSVLSLVKCAPLLALFLFYPLQTQSVKGHFPL